MATDEILQKKPRLGFGLMRLPEKDGGIDIARLSDMADEFLENGFHYFDTAYPYHGGKSETAFKAAVADRYPRDRFTIADKMPVWALKSQGDTGKIFQEQLERTGAGYFDFYLLHSLDADHLKNCDRFGCWDWAQKMKKKGLIRRFGFSFHDTPELLDRILTDHPEVEFVQLQVNYFDWPSKGANSGECYRVARKHGKPVAVMEPVKGGALASFRRDLEEKMRAVSPGRSTASWALRFSAALDGVYVVLSGMSSEDQMRDNIATFKDLEPLSGTETACLREVAEQLHSAPTVGCTACRYCVDGCPQKIRIPDVIREYNAALTYGDQPRLHDAYRRIAGDGHTAGSCIQCGQCEGVCPQHLPIIETLRKASGIFDRQP